MSFGRKLSVLAISSAFALALTSLAPISNAKSGVVLIELDPLTTKECMTAVDKLRSKAASEPGTPLVATHADQAAEYCNQERFGLAVDAISDGYDWLRRKQAKGA